MPKTSKTSKPAAKKSGAPKTAAKAAIKKTVSAPAHKGVKYVYTWGDGKADGDGSQKALLGGKGANLAEMTRLGVKLGGRPETLAGLCGLGDLVLTCSSPQSRNMSFGMELGRGKSAADILAARTAVTEGAETAPAVVEVGRRLGVDLPICEVVLDMIEGRLDARAAVDRLLNRPMKEEA